MCLQRGTKPKEKETRGERSRRSWFSHGEFSSFQEFLRPGPGGSPLEARTLACRVSAGSRSRDFKIKLTVFTIKVCLLEGELT